MFHWLMLFAAIVTEVLGTTALKWATPHAPVAGHAVMVVMIVISFVCLSVAMRRLAMGVAYAIWEGTGLVLLALLSWVLFGEAVTVGQAVAFAAILIGVWLLKSSASHAATEREAPEPTAPLAVAA
jgi:spermidine export protein MdtJ